MLNIWTYYFYSQVNHISIQGLVKSTVVIQGGKHLNMTHKFWYNRDKHICIHVQGKHALVQIALCRTKILG